MRAERAIEKRTAVEAAETRGEVADSMDVRMDLIRRMKAGEIPLDQAQAELKRIKRAGRANGLKTRQQVYGNA